MSVDPINLLAFLGMAIVTYFTRVAGLALAGRLSLSPRARSSSPIMSEGRQPRNSVWRPVAGAW